MGAFFKSLLFAFVMAAVAATQVTGVEKGWLCECSGTPAMTVTDNCASSQCHESEEECPSTSGPLSQEHRHAKVVLELEAQLPSVVLLGAVPPVWVECDPPLWETNGLAPALVVEDEWKPQERRWIEAGAPPPREESALSMVLLV